MIAVCPNPFRDTDFKITKSACSMLREAGYDPVICPVFADDDPGVIPEDMTTYRLEDVADDCSLCIVIGGDGTILAVARQLHDHAVPILGVNLGTKGFMTALEPENLPLVVKAAKGEYQISKRMMLEVDLFREGELIYTDRALNDIVLHGYGDCIQMTAWCNGDKITSFSGDGIILSSPTGSTGYSMSAGGPIVEPDAENIIISPICAHVMGARSFVLDPQREIKVKTEKTHSRRAYMSVDGNSVVDLAHGDTILVKKSPHYTLMASMGLKSFYDIAYEKLT